MSTIHTHEDYYSLEIKNKRMGKDMKTLEPLSIIGENRKQHSLRGEKNSIQWHLKKLKIGLPYDPEISLLVFSQKN